MPLRETIDKMNRAMNESTIKQTEMSSALKENIERMMQQSIAAKQSADELTRALKRQTGNTEIGVRWCSTNCWLRKDWSVVSTMTQAVLH